MLHAAIALATAATSSGVLTLMGRVWLSTISEWPAVTPEAWAVVAATLVGFTFSLTRENEDGAAVVRGVRTALGALMVAGIGTFVVISIGRFLEDTVPLADLRAMVRSLVLALATVCLAWTRTVPGLAELSRLTYPVLVAGGLKVLLADLPSARPAALFVVLACYGASLILTPIVLRGPRRDQPRPS
jgi:hypothetical protein